MSYFHTVNWIKDSLIFGAIALHKIILEDWKHVILKEMISMYVCMHVSFFFICIYPSVYYLSFIQPICLYLSLFIYSFIQ